MSRGCPDEGAAAILGATLRKQVIAVPGGFPLGSDPNLHFDLGVDHLATTAELIDMDDPWHGDDPNVPHPLGLPMQPPVGPTAGWASELQLPGI